VALSSAAAAFDLRHAASGSLVRWQQSDVTIEIDPSVADAVPGALDAVISSAAAWSLAEGVPRLAVTMAETRSAPAVDGRNVVYFAPDGDERAGRALAVTLVSFDDVTGEIVDADIVLNGRYEFAVLPADASAAPGDDPILNDLGPSPSYAPAFATAAGPFDIVHVVAHETGHLLGLLDAVDDPTDVMYVYTAPHDASRRTPTHDDAAGVEALYNEASTTSSGCALARPDVRSRSDAALVLVPIGAFAVVRRVRRRASTRVHALP
jgi:hypothetical protein